MATLTVWKFDNPTGAGEALAKLESLQKQLNGNQAIRNPRPGKR
jgi:hypothetical protein